VLAHSERARVEDRNADRRCTWERPARLGGNLDCHLRCL